jgi:hypothetical protein
LNPVNGDYGAEAINHERLLLADSVEKVGYPKLPDH